MEIQETKAYLKSNKITYEQLSASSGIPLNTLKNIFSGRTPNPRIDTMQAIEQALGFNRESLEWTEADKEAGIIVDYREKMSADEREMLDLYRAVKDEKGEKAAQAIRTLTKTYLDGK